VRHSDEGTGMEEPLDKRREWTVGRTDRHQNQNGEDTVRKTLCTCNASVVLRQTVKRENKFSPCGHIPRSLAARNSLRSK
jgi:hypothetical protein